MFRLDECTGSADSRWWVCFVDGKIRAWYGEEKNSTTAMADCHFITCEVIETTPLRSWFEPL